MPGMASVETMARSQLDHLEAGKLKLAKFKERSKNKSRNKNASPDLSKKSATPDAKVTANGNPKAERSSQFSTSSPSDVVKGIEVVHSGSFAIEPEIGRWKDTGEIEGKRKQQEIEETRRKNFEAEEAIKNEREAEDQRKQLELVERFKRIEYEAEETKRRRWEAVESKRKDCEDAEQARQNVLIVKVAKQAECEAEEVKQKEREAEEVKRRQLLLAEYAKRKEREAEEIKKREQEAEAIKRKEHEAEEVKWRQRAEEEVRRKQREEFSGLEQHIQDLTEEKFGLQRELAKARAMTENFVTEHYALVENFNNQGQLVNQLKQDIEGLEVRMKEREAFATATLSERDIALQECEAAREQSQLMAGEVIVLENRIRTLRSRELKMEKDVCNLSSEVESCKKLAAAWEQDRAHLQTLIDALNEEKKVMQVRLRKVASGEREFSYRSENSEAAQSRERVLADASTSTDDLPPSPLKISSEGPSTPLISPSLDSWRHSRQFEEPLSSQSTVQSSHLRSTYESFIPSPLSGERYSQLLSAEPEPSSLTVLAGSFIRAGYQSINLQETSTSIPVDVMRTINNISDIINSLSEEKSAIVKALRAESKAGVELRTKNADLSKKLEATTQQLELGVAQRMVDGNSTTGLSTSRYATAALDYVDEGDEVVDRVFTWIMQLFPSRKSRRNGVKRL